MDEGEIADLDEALLVISLKNDEINNMRSSIRATEKKTSLRLTDLQFRIDQEKARVAEVERKANKADEAARRTREDLEEQLKKAQEDRHRLTETITELHSEARKKEREAKAALFEGQLQLEREREVSARLTTELEQLQRYFDPKKILAVLQKRSLEEVPSYMEVYRRGLEREEEAQQLGLEMERLRAETYHSIEESFRKLSSYEAVMETLKSKNSELEDSIQLKEEQLQEHSRELDEKRELIEAVREQASQQVDLLSDQIHSLSTYVHHAPSDDDPATPDAHLHFHTTIEQLELALQEREAQLADLQAEFEEQLAVLREENGAMKSELVGVHLSAMVQREDLEATVTVLRRELAEKDDLVLLLNASIKDQEEFFEEKQREFDHYIADLKDLLAKKYRAEEDSRQNEALYRAQIDTLTEELNFLRHYLDSHEQQHQDARDELSSHQGSEEEPALRRVRSGLESMRSRGEPHNLLAELREEGESEGRVDIGSYEQEPNWTELYYALLLKHNQFARQVQTRLQAIARPH